MTEGSLDGLTPATEDDLPGIVLGKDLAGEIGAKVGDTVTLLTPNGTLSPMGVMPRQRRFKVVGIVPPGPLRGRLAASASSISSAACCSPAPIASITSS